jgi:succinate dehydrogenase / fumarate reductase cytochrome b subunit
MSQKIVDRPVNINLFKIRLPISALISITHRLSGIYVFFVTLPLSIILFQQALTELSYDAISLLIQTSSFFSTFVYFSFLIFLYHILTGFRHLLMDIHIGENLKASNMSAIFVISFWLVVSIFILFGIQI